MLTQTKTFLIVEQCLACQRLIQILFFNKTWANFFLFGTLCQMRCSFYARFMRRTQLFTVCKWYVNIPLLSDRVIDTQGYAAFPKWDAKNEKCSQVQQLPSSTSNTAVSSFPGPASCIPKSPHVWKARDIYSLTKKGRQIPVNGSKVGENKR